MRSIERATLLDWLVVVYFRQERTGRSNDSIVRPFWGSITANSYIIQSLHNRSIDSDRLPRRASNYASLDPKWRVKEQSLFERIASAAYNRSFRVINSCSSILRILQGTAIPRVRVRRLSERRGLNLNRKSFGTIEGICVRCNIARCRTLRCFTPITSSLAVTALLLFPACPLIAFIGQRSPSGIFMISGIGGIKSLISRRRNTRPSCRVSSGHGGLFIILDIRGNK